MKVVEVHQRSAQVREVQMRVVDKHKDLLMQVRDRIEEDPDSVFELVKWLWKTPPRVVIDRRRGRVIVDADIDLVVR